MKLFSLRKRVARHARPAHRAEPLPALSPQDHAIAAWNGITDAHFANLPAIVQVDLRESYFMDRRL